MKIKIHQNERAVALLIVLFMVSFLFIMVTANGNAIFSLKREIKLVEKKQKARWSQISSNTNRLEQRPQPKP